MRIIRFLAKFGLIWSVAIFLATPTMAASEFEVDYQTLYQLDEMGRATVTHNIALTNKLSAVYATKFALAVGLTDVNHIIVKDAVGQIEPEISRDADQVSIDFEFIDKVAGKGKVNQFSISYQTADIITRNGSVWEINIPRLEGEHAVSTYGVTLIVPVSFGSPAHISPSPDESNISLVDGKKFNVYKFAPHLGYQEPITAVFGREQFMDFQLSYHLENTAAVDKVEKIALPPDTAYQQIAFKQIEPKPEQVILDEDGNRLASYTLSPGQLLTIQVAGVSKIKFEPQTQPTSEELLAVYLKPEEFWQADNGEIQALAAKLSTPKAIYQYVVDTLSYSYDKVNQGGGRVGALGALSAPELAICTEFTDLFIALARAAGIPARELEGYAFTTNDRLRPLSLTQDVLHAWPEFYDRERQTWIQIDPTWGKTTGGVDYFDKLDLNHFVFVIHGLDPNLPSPAGAYKLRANPEKDVEVHASAPVPWPKFDLAISLENSANPWKPALVVRNVGPVAANTEITLVSTPPGIINERVQLQSLPPFGHTVIPLKPRLPWSLQPINFNLRIDDGQRQFNLGISAQKPISTPAKIAFITGGGILGALAFVTRRLRLRRRRGEQPLHW